MPERKAIVEAAESLDCAAPAMPAQRDAAGNRMVSTYFHGFLVNSFAGDDPLVCFDHVPMSDDALTTAIRAVLAASPFHSEGHRKGCPRNGGSPSKDSGRFSSAAWSARFTK
jgi:hypothetical protein